MPADPAHERLCIRTRELPDGRVLETWLHRDGEVLTVVDPSEEPGAPESPDLRLPPEAVDAVFARYGRPLDAQLPPAEEDDASVHVRLPGTDATLRGFEYRAPVDVIANDWLVLERPGREPLAAPAKLVGAALVAVARAYAVRAQDRAN